LTRFLPADILQVHYFAYIVGEIAAGGLIFAPVAQLVEHVLGKDEASGSKPLGGFFKKQIFCDSVE
jgi:hypothetical protein